jgi:hypothetical protein
MNRIKGSLCCMLIEVIYIGFFYKVTNRVRSFDPFRARDLVIFLFVHLPDCSISHHTLVHSNLGFVFSHSMVSLETSAQDHSFNVSLGNTPRCGVIPDIWMNLRQLATYLHHKIPRLTL